MSQPGQRKHKQIILGRNARENMDAWGITGRELREILEHPESLEKRSEVHWLATRHKNGLAILVYYLDDPECYRVAAVFKVKDEQGG